MLLKNVSFRTGLLLIAAFFCIGCNSHPYLRYISAKTLRQHLEVIASDSMEGREMATVGERRAAAYISSTFRNLNLNIPAGTNEYLQGFDVIRDTVEEATLRVGATTFALKRYGRIDPWLNSNSTLTADTIVFAGYGIDTTHYSDYTNIDVRGKVILICDGEPKTDSSHYLISGTNRRSVWSRYPGDGERKLTAAKAHGAKAVFIYEPFDTISAAYAAYAAGGYHPPKEIERAKDNIYMVIGTPIAKAMLGEHRFDEVASAQRRREKFTSSFSTVVPIDYHFQKHTLHTTANNVIGYIEGTDKKDECVVISAHYDHLGKRGSTIYYGADDNGSGTSALLNIAEAFSVAAASGHRPRRSVVFLSVTGEEKGLFGSRHYVANPIFPLMQTVADVNTDMIGRIDSAHEQNRQYMYIIGAGRLSSSLQAINERNNAAHTRLLLDYTYDAPTDPNRFYYRSDHYEFAQKNIPIIFYFDGVHEDYHRSTDTVEKIDFDLMKTRTQLIFLTAWEIANRDERLKVDRSGE